MNNGLIILWNQIISYPYLHFEKIVSSSGHIFGPHLACY